MSISICISLLIFPLFSTIDIENRFSYCLKYFQRMYYLIIQAFLSRDRMNAKILLSRASIIEQMIRQTMIIIQSRLSETNYEPSRFLQRIFSRKHIIDLTIQGLFFSGGIFQVSILKLKRVRAKIVISGRGAEYFKFQIGHY
jgi:hypothetical protein